MPTDCVICHQNIWGVGKAGKTCKVHRTSYMQTSFDSYYQTCGVSVHNRCELKVSAAVLWVQNSN